MKNDSKKYQFTDVSLSKGYSVQFVIDVKWANTATGYVQVFRRDEGEDSFIQY